MKTCMQIVWPMKWLVALLGIAIGPHALANPKLTVRAVLQMEQVEAVIQGKTASVTGTFRFDKVFGDPKLSGQVFFPVFCPKGTSATLPDLNFHAKLNGHKAVSYSIATNAPLSLPPFDAYSVAWILATFPPQAFKIWRLEVSYEQELLDGVFYYLPILGEARQSHEPFEIRVKADRPICSIGKAGGVITKGANELLFMPVNLRPISVSTNPGDATRAFADRQGATGVTVTNLSWSTKLRSHTPLSDPSIEAAERINLLQKQRPLRR